MEFHEKLQELRKQKNLTQEELAASLYVSRTAVSKWESGRGYPNIDSLRALSAFFSVTIDELLFGEERIDAAEKDGTQKEKQRRNRVCGALDLSMGLLFFLPVFKQNAYGSVRAVSLMSLTAVQPYIKVFFGVFIVGMILLGMLRFAWSEEKDARRARYLRGASLVLGAAGVVLLSVCQHPYAVVYTFVCWMMKGMLSAKSR